MALERENSIGSIKLDDYIFAQLIRTAVHRTDGKALFASEKGKLLGGQGLNPSIGDVASSIKVTETEGHYELEFYIIMSFGASISQTTADILDYIEYELAGLLPDKGGKITLRIVGVKSKKIAQRDLTVEREFEAKLRS